MTTTLNDLFDQIIHSERKAEERKNYLLEVKTKLVALEEELSDSQNEHKRLKGQLLLKIQRWKEEELKLNFLTSRQSILLEQKQSLEAEKNETITQLKQIQSERLTGMTAFCTATEIFSENYDLVSLGSARREKEALKQAEQLEEPGKLLNEELDGYEKRMCVVRKLEAELDHVRQQRDEKTRQIQDLETDILNVKDRVKTLKNQKSVTASLPQTGEDFKKLHKELESAQCEELESQCQVLNSEQTSLQQELRQKTLQQQQQQRILHEQHRRKHTKVLSDVKKPQARQDSAPIDSCNKLTVTNFSRRSANAHSPRHKSQDCRDVLDNDFDDDGDDDMFLPDLPSFHT